MFHILDQDLARAIVGPFDTWTAAADHIAFCSRRGDEAAAGARIHVGPLTDQQRRWADITLTPAEDRAFTV